MTQFTDLGLAKPILQALAAEGYVTPTPIQAQAIPAVLKGGDLLGIAQTGTGKTAAFALPILQRLADNKKPAPRRGCRVLVLSPTRELASQIADSFRTYGKHMGVSVAVIFGGVKYGPQVRALAGGIDVLVATPGRLIDHLGEKTVTLAEAEILVLDEADQMLDLGFLQPIRRIVSHLPKVRQNLFFSATMPGEIGKLADELLNNPVKVSVAPQATTIEKIRQHLIYVEGAHKRELLAELLADPKHTRTIVFTRTKRGADRVAEHLERAGIDAAAIHGDKSQGQRERALAAFKAGQVRALVATDIAARGIDVDAVSHVINYELPNVPEAYVHRIGRTARAGAEGSAISFCADEERSLLRDIEKLTRQQIPFTDRRRDRSLALMTAANGSAGNEGRPQQKPRGQQQPRGRGGPGGGGGNPGQHPRRPQPKADGAGAGAAFKGPRRNNRTRGKGGGAGGSRPSAQA